MKITHWSVIFLAIILPFSLICRSTVQKKILVLQDQTRIDNVLDNATYDAVSQIVEVAEELGYGKNVPITHGIAMASINRFFQSMAVNFNLPSNVDVAKDYFGQYIPVIMIIGYDGIYVYSYDLSSNSYCYDLKPKIPYAYTDPSTGLIMNFTLGNDLKVYIPQKSIYLEGRVGEISDEDRTVLGSVVGTADDAITVLPYLTDNLSLIFDMYHSKTSNIIAPSYLYNGGLSNGFWYGAVEQDYEFDEVGQVIKDANQFHKLRRDTIVNLIIATLQQEVNEHETYAHLIGMNYNFNIPNISREEWNNSIDDISVLAFFQGMPMGVDSYYNNYSLGGSRIVQTIYIYTTNDANGKLYHKHTCERVHPDSSGDPTYYDRIFINRYHAIEEGYHACELCR